MTTTADLIAETQRYLMSGHREPLNMLSGSHNNSTTTFTFANDLANLSAGAYVSVDLEIVYVWSVNTSGKTAVVQRGMLGSTAATHATGALTTINPRFPDFTVFQALNADIDDLCTPSNGLWQSEELSLTYNAAIAGYDMTGASDVINVIRVRHDSPGPYKNWPEIRKWQLKYEQPTTTYPSGMTLVLYEPGWPGLSIRVTYSKRFAHLATIADDVTAVAGLSATMMDIPPLGAAARLAGVREVARNFTEAQADPRRAGEVPPNAQQAGANALMRLRAQRIKSEALRLSNQYPTRRMV